MSFLYFIILIGVLIFVHEFGHFIVAKFFDVKVINFSIGFGPSFASYTWGDTEYSLRILPLGGYVQMQGSDLETAEALPEEEQERSLMAKPIWQRSLIVLAGPVANLILPLFIYFGFGLVQTTTPPPQIGEIHAAGAAEQAGLQPGDEMVAINGRDIDYWYQAAGAISDSPDQPMEITVARNGERHTVELTPERTTSTDFLGLATDTSGRIGIGLGTYGPTIALADRQGPAARDGLRFFDRVIAIDGEPIERFDEIDSHLRQSGGQPMEFLVASRSQIPVDYAGLFHQEARRVTVTPERVDDHYTLGIERAEMYLAAVQDDGPAYRAGLQPGDQILALDERPFNNWALFRDRIQNDVNERIVARDEAGDDDPIEPTYELTIQRADQRLTLDYQPDIITYQDDTNQTLYRVHHGWENFPHTVLPDDIPHALGPRILHSADQAADRTWEFTKMMVVGLVRLAQGRISTESIGGPIMIGELAAEAGDRGIEPFLQMMALISINLAIINLLPIPVLDGGRLLLFALEAAKRGPLSYRTRQIAAYIGLVMVILLMVFAFKNDIERNWYRVVEFFED